MNSCSYRKALLGVPWLLSAGTLPLVGQEAVTITSAPWGRLHTHHLHITFRGTASVLDFQPRLRSGPRISGSDWRKRTRIHRRTFVMTKVARICGWALMLMRSGRHWGQLLHLPPPPCAPCSGPGKDDPDRSINYGVLTAGPQEAGTREQWLLHPPHISWPQPGVSTSN